MTDRAWQQELLLTLRCVQEIRQKCDHTELGTVRQARKAGLSWTEIAGALSVTRQSAWERAGTSSTTRSTVTEGSPPVWSDTVESVLTSVGHSAASDSG
jgi:hypothetical protein